MACWSTRLRALLLALPLWASVSHADLSFREQTNWRVAEIYIATLSRAIDAGGLAFWVGQVDGPAQWTLTDVARRFFYEPEVRALYPESLSLADFVQALYQNVLGRDPDAEGYSFWVEALRSGRFSREEMVLALVDGVWSNPGALLEGADARWLRHRVEVGLAFAERQQQLGISFAQLSEQQQLSFQALTRDMLVGVGAEVAGRDSALAQLGPAIAPLSQLLAVDSGQGSGEAVFCDTERGSIEWMNRFDAAPEGTVIGAIDVAFGAAFAGVDGARFEGLPVSLVVYDDPDNDGNPADIRVLSWVAGSVSNYGSDSFVRFDIPDTRVDGSFFVAARLDAADIPEQTDLSGLRLARVDEGDRGSRSWVRCKGGQFFNNTEIFEQATAPAFMLRAVRVAETGW